MLRTSLEQLAFFFFFFKEGWVTKGKTYSKAKANRPGRNFFGRRLVMYVRVRGRGRVYKRLDKREKLISMRSIGCGWMMFLLCIL